MKKNELPFTPLKIAASTNFHKPLKWQIASFSQLMEGFSFSNFHVGFLSPPLFFLVFVINSIERCKCMTQDFYFCQFNVCFLFYKCEKGILENNLDLRALMVLLFKMSGEGGGRDSHRFYGKVTWSKRGTFLEICCPVHFSRPLNGNQPHIKSIIFSALY